MNFTKRWWINCTVLWTEIRNKQRHIFFMIKRYEALGMRWQSSWCSYKKNTLRIMAICRRSMVILCQRSSFNWWKSTVICWRCAVIYYTIIGVNWNDFSGHYICLTVHRYDQLVSKWTYILIKQYWPSWYNGNLLQSENSMRHDVAVKGGKFIWKINSMLQELHFVDSNVFMKLVNIYCTTWIEATYTLKMLI